MSEYAAALLCERVLAYRLLCVDRSMRVERRPSRLVSRSIHTAPRQTRQNCRACVGGANWMRATTRDCRRPTESFKSEHVQSNLPADADALFSRVWRAVWIGSKCPWSERLDSVWMRLRAQMSDCVYCAPRSYRQVALRRVASRRVLYSLV